MQIRFPGLLCLGLLVAVQANAEDGFFSKVSLLGGVSVGQLSLDRDSFASPTGLQGFEATATAWTPAIGLEFNRYLSAELGRFNGGSPSQQTLISAPAPPLVAGVCVACFGNGHAADQ